MRKCNSLIELVAKDDQRKSEFNMKTKQYPFLSILRANSFTSYSPIKFPKLSSSYNTHFTKKRITDDVKYTAIKTHIYSALSIVELMSMKFNERNILEVKASSFFSCLFKLLVRYKFRKEFNNLFNNRLFFQIMF